MWRTNGFRKVVFPHIIASARYCAFSYDNTYIGIATNNEINVYLFQKLTGQYQFIQILTTQVPQVTLFLTSINFSPIDST